jgi:SNF2 family DNA or RNA helicase
MNVISHISRGAVVNSAEDNAKRRGIALAALAKLKQICDHPELPSISGGEDSNDFHDRVLEGKTPQELRENSGKLLFLEEMLSEFKKNKNRCLIFAQYTRMLDLIEYSVLDPR